MEFQQCFIPPDADIEKIRSGDEEHLAKVARVMHEIWTFHYSKMPGEDWDRAKARLEESL